MAGSIGDGDGEVGLGGGVGVGRGGGPGGAVDGLAVDIHGVAVHGGGGEVGEALALLGGEVQGMGVGVDFGPARGGAARVGRVPRESRRARGGLVGLYVRGGPRRRLLRRLGRVRRRLGRRPRGGRGLRDGLQEVVAQAVINAGVGGGVFGGWFLAAGEELHLGQSRSARKGERGARRRGVWKPKESRTSLCRILTDSMP